MMYNKDEKTGELYHYGIRGQKWGVRRYQNEDGSYTDAGKAWRLKQQGRISKYSHGTNNVRTAQRTVSRRNIPQSLGAWAGSLATGAGIGAAIGGPVGMGTGIAIGHVVGMGAALVNTYRNSKMIQEMQDYAESSKNYADKIIGQTGDMQVSDIINKK